MHRVLLIAIAHLALGACGDARAPEAGCTRTATQEVAWTGTEASDVVTAAAQGPSCAQAVVVFTVRNAGGDPLWAFAATQYEMRAGGAPPPEGAPELTEAEMDVFLAGWANVEISRSGDLPAWREDAATLTESAHTFSYATPFDRETYEMLRAHNLPTLCFAVAAEAVQCLVMDPASNAPTMIVAYGP